MDWLKGLNQKMVDFQAKAKTKLVFGRPYKLVIDPGNICNLECPFCPTGQKRGSMKRGFLSLEDFKRILGQFPLARQVNLFNWGEPFLNPDIFGMVMEAKKRKIFVQIHSNLNHFSPEMARQLVESRLDLLVISLDGASQESYERYRRKGDFNRVIENIRLIEKTKNELGKDRPFIEWKFLINRFNEAEKEKAVEMAKELGVKLKFDFMDMPKEAMDDWLPRQQENSHYDLKTHEPKTNPYFCYMLWQVPSINFDGKVFPCCILFDDKDAVGNLLEQDFDEIWNGEKMKAMRHYIATGEGDCQACRNCGFNPWQEGNK